MAPMARQRMKKKECMDAVPMLVERWRREENLSESPLNELSSSNFTMWLSHHYPEYLSFRPRAGGGFGGSEAIYDMEPWFDTHTNQLWKR